MKTSPYNPFNYLETTDEISEYLNNAYMEDDPQIFLIALGHLAKQKGMAETAREAGVNRESLYKSLSGEGNPNYRTIFKVIRALGLEMHFTQNKVA